MLAVVVHAVPVSAAGQDAHVTGGSHHSVVIEMADHTVVVEGPLNDERAAAVIAEARRLVPGKPIRYVVIGWAPRLRGGRHHRHHARE